MGDEGWQLWICARHPDSVLQNDDGFRASLNFEHRSRCASHACIPLYPDIQGEKRVLAQKKGRSVAISEYLCHNTHVKRVPAQKNGQSVAIFAYLCHSTHVTLVCGYLKAAAYRLGVERPQQPSELLQYRNTKAVRNTRMMSAESK